MALACSGLRHLALCCLQTNILPNWLVTSTQQCIPVHHKMSGYGGMISDILTVCGVLINIPFSSTDTILQSTIHLLCLKQWLMCMVIWTFTYMNRNACDQNKLMLKIFIPYLQLLIMSISFVSMTCISHWQICFSKGLVSRS